MTSYKVQELDANKLRENALTSIRLGIEDFGLTKDHPKGEGDPARALSSIRNLFAGVLLLLKYKILSSVEDPKEASSLIFVPPKNIQPIPDGEGGILWEPAGNFQKGTIDVDLIKKRLDSFDISFDWAVIQELQKARNNIEHLHPENSLNELSGLIAQLFPALRIFIEEEMSERPVEILETAWPIMLAHADFYNGILKECRERWEAAGVPTLLQSILKISQCDNCSSYLIQPDDEALDDGRSVERDEANFDYACRECGDQQSIADLLISTLHFHHGFHPTDDVDPSVASCIWCDHDTFVVSDLKCFWCEAELDYKQCYICEEPLGQEDQLNNGMCGYHAHVFEKVMKE
ncbi:hypothetical protein [Salinicola aestuarinus]|uniref:hypothetical protein n=1 Tax=Salinicola aestuarinus TaxID=1949082 RepID=UPI000DA252BB|nr:hypothetical protein [Salinicola aestuarinus]